MVYRAVTIIIAKTIPFPSVRWHNGSEAEAESNVEPTSYYPFFFQVPVPGTSRDIISLPLSSESNPLPSPAFSRAFAIDFHLGNLECPEDDVAVRDIHAGRRSSDGGDNS